MITNFVKLHFTVTQVYYPMRTVRRLLIFYKIIGLWPSSIPTVSNERILIPFTPSKFGIAYNIIFVILFIGTNIVVFPEKVYSSYPGKSSIVDSVDILQNVLSMFVMISSLLYFAFSQKIMVKIANKLIKVQRKFDSFEFSCHREPLFYRFMILCISIHLFVLYYFVLMCACYIRNKIITNTYVFLAYALDYMVIVFVTSCLAEYSLIIKFLTARLTEVNKCIKFTSKSLQMKFVARSLNPNQEVTFNSSILARMLRVEDVSTRLFKISDNVNELFSVPILFVMTYVFVYLTIIIFYIVVLLISNTEYDYSNILGPITFVSVITYPTAVLMFTITTLKKKVTETARNVHHLLKCTNDEKLISEFKLFSLQLLHEKPQFSACGFFDLDCSLLKGIIGAVTTYLIILIQFQVTNNIPK